MDSRMDVAGFFAREKHRTLRDCSRCGLCVKRCKALAESELSKENPREVQEATLAFLADKQANPIIHERVKACMRCYGCTSICPEGINPLRTLDICVSEMVRQQLMDSSDWDPKSPDLVHRVLASLQVSATDYQRIFKLPDKKEADVVFFPGCNIYYQPEKLLNALDIMSMVDEHFQFLPGLDLCCGNCQLTRGRLSQAGTLFEELMTKIGSYRPKTVVFWCPTCLCIAKTGFDFGSPYPFSLVTLAQYITANLDKLRRKKSLTAQVTVHDACKIALTGIDIPGSRQILEFIGAEVIEMDRCMEQAACCGCAAIRNHPEVGERMLEERLLEAKQTGAEILVTVCHYCSQMLASKQDDSRMRVENYINLLATCLGIEREDKFRTYMHWRDKNRILADAAAYIKQSPFPYATIEKTVVQIFGQQ